MAKTNTTGGRGPARRGSTKATLTQLRQRRDQVDADLMARRKKEDAALGAFAEAEAAATALAGQVERELAELERQQAEVRAKAERQSAEVDARRGAALLELAELGRSADELAQMTDIPVKRVRAMLRAARSARSHAATVAEGPSRAADDPKTDASGDESPSPTEDRTASGLVSADGGTVGAAAV